MVTRKRMIGGKFNSSQSKEKVNHYLCNIAMASLVFSWSSPNVKAKRRASSLIPLKEGDDLSKLYPFSWIISLKSCVNKTFFPPVIIQLVCYWTALFREYFNALSLSPNIIKLLQKNWASNILSKPFSIIFGLHFSKYAGMKIGLKTTL